MFTINIETSHNEVASPMYKGPVPTPCVIYKHVMVDTTNEGDEYIYKQDPKTPDATGIMAVEGNTINFLHHQEQNKDNLTKKYPVWEVNGKKVDTFKIREVKVDGKTTIKYKPSAEDVFMTVTVEEEQKVAEEEEEEVMEEEVMGEEKEEKEEEEDDEVMSDEEGKKEEVSVKDAHPNLLIAQDKAKKAAEAVAAKELADQLKLAQDKADKVAYDEISAPIKEMSAAIEAKKAELNDMVKAKFERMYEAVQYVPLSVIPEPVGMIKEVGRKDAREFDVVTSNKANEEMVNKLARMTVWGNNMNDKAPSRINLREDVGKVFGEYCRYNPEQKEISQAALVAYNLAMEDKKKDDSKKRKNEGDTGDSKRGGKAPRRTIGATDSSRSLNKALKNKK